MTVKRLSPGKGKTSREVFHNYMEKTWLGDIPALFYYRDKRGRKPIVIMQHSAHFLKEELGIWCHRLADKGYFVAAIDARHHGERVHPEQDDMFANRFTELLADVVEGTARDIGKVIEYLKCRPEADTGRIGMAGFSMGGWVLWGTLVAEPRITCGVSVVSAGALVEMARNRSERQKKKGKSFRQAIKRLEKVDAVLNPEKAATRPILMLNGADDHPMVDFAQRTAEAVEPLCRMNGFEFKSVTYPGVGHKFTPEMEQELYRWFNRLLKKRR